MKNNRVPPPLPPKTWKGTIPYLLSYRLKEIMFFVIIILLIIFAFMWFLPDEMVKIIKAIKR